MFFSSTTDEEIPVTRVIRALADAAPPAPVPMPAPLPPAVPAPRQSAEAAPEPQTTNESGDYVDMPSLYRELHGLTTDEEERPEPTSGNVPRGPRGFGGF